MMDRRDLLKLLGLASATAACDVGPGDARLIPLLVPPADGAAPGEARFLHSTCTECPAGCGLLVKVMNGRPVKLEGHPDHPVNRGALCLRGQASLERLYHPRRLRAPFRREPDGDTVEIGWRTAFAEIRDAVEKSRRNGKKSFFVSSATSGTLSLLIDEFCDTLGVERLPEVELFHHGAIRRANEAVYGRAVVPDYRIDKAELLISIGVDFLETWLSPVSLSRRFAAFRDAGGRSIHIEPHLTLTGLAADERLIITPSTESMLLAHLLRATGAFERLPEAVARAVPSATIEETVRITGLPKARLIALARGLRDARRPLLIVGGVATAHAGGAAIAALAALVQRALAMERTTLDFERPMNLDRVGDLEDVRRRLMRKLDENDVGVLFLSRLPTLDRIDNLVPLLDRAETVVVLSDFPTSATEKGRFVLPLSHGLESAGDVEPRAGLRSVVRPLIPPLHNTRSESDILLGLLDDKRAYAACLEKRWAETAEALGRNGFVELSGKNAETLQPIDELTVSAFLMSRKQHGFVAENALYVVPSLRAHDGRSNVLSLTREIPDPLSSISYGRSLAISEYDAGRDSLKDNDEVEVSMEAGSITLPLRIQAGLPAGCMMLAIDAAEGLTLPADPLTGEARVLFADVKLAPTGRRVPLPLLAGSARMEPKRAEHILGHAPSRNPRHGRDGRKHGAAPLDPLHERRDCRWAMVVDLDLCTGCSACVAACYVENNIPVTGAEEHLRGRELSWLRIQTYADDGRIVVQPRMCQHCDNAPCEPVCPVHATYHNPEGLNAMIYNRCVGTRYCANNCPYKARRFNWFEYEREAPFDRMINPEVWERPKGVMEKCSFCVQRIRKAKDQAKDEGRKVRDGEIVPACAQTCPTGAIVFGNIRDERSRVHRLSRSARAFRVLAELGTEPAVYYLAKKNREG
jgi:Fe-S-cluster-containing dehydrogenase component/anaerobic selenocysteine-containing dehydrogenase